MPAAIRFDHVCKRYGTNEVLRDISFDIAPGEFFGLVGMNGAGKTTLIKCLLDFCQTDGGRIEIFGASRHLTEARRRLAYLPERFMPPYYLTGRDFLKYMLKLQALPYRPDDAEAMLQALDLDLAALARPVRSYSKGMTQKLGLAACFLADRDLYVLDEPMSGLDPKARALLKARLQALRDSGRSLFFSSHALADVEEICDRMAILHDGQLRFVGSPAECCRQYAAPTLEQAYLKCIG
jgi:ABC-2 type transport system ATP-binding protein